MFFIVIQAVCETELEWRTSRDEGTGDGLSADEPDAFGMSLSDEERDGFACFAWALGLLGTTVQTRGVISVPCDESAPSQCSQTPSSASSDSSSSALPSGLGASNPSSLEPRLLFIHSLLASSDEW